MQLVDRIAGRQWGLITVNQLRQIGFDDRRIRSRTDAGDLIRVRRQVYRLPGTPQCWEQVVLATALAGGEGTVVSHTTAAAVWELKHSDRYRARLHLTAPGRTRMKGVIGHQGRLSATERTVCRDIPVTTAERTIVDLAGSLTQERLAQCIDDALRRHLVRLDRLRRLVADTAAVGLGPRPVAPLHDILADRIVGYRPGDSDWEREMDRQWDRLGLPASVRQFRVTAHGRSYRIDRAIPELKIGVEWEGFDSHGTRSGFDRGSARRAALTAEGWHMIDFTSRSTPDLIARAVGRAVKDRATRT